MATREDDFFKQKHMVHSNCTIRARVPLWMFALLIIFFIYSMRLVVMILLWNEDSPDYVTSKTNANSFAISTTSVSTPLVDSNSTSSTDATTSMAHHKQHEKFDSATSNSTRRKVVLLGPHDRYNFGDLIFEKVAIKLLSDRAGYDVNDIVSAGLVSVDMSRYGGNPRVLSLKEVQEMSFAAPLPFDIVYLGGEALACNYECGVRAMQTQGLKDQAMANKLHSCAYLLPKRLLVPDHFKGPSNIAVVNSMGGGLLRPCKEAVHTADYYATRDGLHGTLAPDSAVVVNLLFGDHVRNLRNFPSIQHIYANTTNGNYIAVQHKQKAIDVDLVARRLDAAAASFPNCSIVFFAAGTAPNHDSLEVYEQISNRLRTRSFILREENMWYVIAVISHARLVVCTSLHVRIMAFIFQKPRITWCPTNGKHDIFIRTWEGDPQSVPCVPELSADSERLFLDGVNQTLQASANWTFVDGVVQAYLESFDTWSGMLRNDTRI